MLKDLGAKAHPRSGAGRIKHDGSTHDELVEVKSARKQFALRLVDLAVLYKRAVQEGKEPLMVVTFDDGYEAHITVSRRS